MPSPQLIASAQAGNATAITSLLAEAQPDIRRYARQSCKAVDVDDAVQDAMWLLHRHIGGLRAVAAFSTWMFAVVKRECLRLSKRPSSTDTESMADDVRFSHRPDVELRLDLVAAIQSLPEHYRTIIVLRDFEEHTILEIAVGLGLTREATKARLHRARALMREYLDR